MRRRLSIALLIALTLSGCGYRMMGRPAQNGSAPTVAIITLRNDSNQPGTELIVTEMLRREFLSRGILQVVSDPDSADFVLAGRIRPFDIISRTVTSITLALEYSINIQLDLRVEPRGEEAYPIPRLNASAIYIASADVEVERKNRAEAIRRIADVLAVRAHDFVELRLSP